MTSRVHIRSVFQIVLFCSCMFLSRAGIAATDSGGWDLLWQNKYAEAETEFTTALTADSKDLDARRGLMLARSALGHDHSLAEDLKAYSKGAPHGPYDLLLLKWLDRHNGLQSKKYYKSLVQFTETLAKSKSLNLIDQRMALDALVEYYRILGETSKVKKTSEQLNRIMEWRILGPFDNTAGSGHIKDFVDIEYIPAGAQLVGKFGQRISWFTPTLVDLSGAVSPLAHFYQKNSTTAYARTEVKLREAGTYLLSMGYLGDLDVFVNGVLVFQGVRSAGGGEVLQKLLELPSGWTNITCKISNRDQFSGFTCSLSNPDGSSIDKLEIDPVQDGHTRLKSAEVGAFEGGMLAEIKELAAAQPDDPEVALWNLRRAVRQSKSEELDAQCKAILDSFPANGLLRLAVIEIYRSQDMSTDKLLRETVEIAPELSQTRLMQARLDIEKKRYKSARAQADEVIKIAKDCREAHGVRINSLIFDQLWSDMKAAAYRAKVTFPNESFAYLAYVRYAQETGNRADVKKFRKEALARMLPGSRRESSFLSDWEKEDYKEAKDAVKKMVDADPGSSWNWTVYIYALMANEDYEEAFKTTRRCLASFPQDVMLIKTLAQFVESGYVLVDDDFRGVLSASARNSLSQLMIRSGTKNEIRELFKQEAARILQRAINSAPGDLGLRERVANLMGKTPYRDILPDPKVDSIASMRVAGDSYPGEDSVILLNQKRRLVFEPGVSLLDHVLAVQILTRDGIAAWENYDIPYGRSTDVVVLAKSILKENGSEEDGRKYLRKVMFPSLEIGDIVFLHYQATQIATGKLHHEFWDQFFFASAAAPVLKARYSVSVAPDLEFQYNLWNANDADPEETPRVKNVDRGYRKYQWTVTNLPRAGKELVEPDPRRIYPWLDLSTIPDWQNITKWYLDMSEGQQVVSPLVEEKALELTSELSTPQEKIDAIYNYVANSITYESVPFFQTAYIPRLPDEVLQDKFGDCKDKSCLMITMLRAVGLKNFRFALVTPRAPADRPFFPSPRFNHAIVCQVGWRGDLTWYDPTLANVETGQIPSYLGGTLALVVDADSTGLQEIPAAPITDTPYESDSQVALNADGIGRINHRASFRQIDQLARLRGVLKDEEPGELISRQAHELSVKYPGVVVDSVSVTGVEPGDSAVTITTKFQVPEMGMVDEGILSMKVPWSSQLVDAYGMVAAERTREEPLDLGALAMSETDEVQLLLPPPYSMRKLPAGVLLQWHDCRYETKYSRVQGGLLARRTLIVDGDLVSLAAYPEFKVWFDSVRRDLNKTHHLHVN